MRRIVMEILWLEGTPDVVHEMVWSLPVFQVSPPFGEVTVTAVFVGVFVYAHHTQNPPARVMTMPAAIHSVLWSFIGIPRVPSLTGLHYTGSGNTESAYTIGMSIRTKVAIFGVIAVAAGAWFVFTDMRTPPPPAPQPPVPTARVSYYCNGGKTITTAYYAGAPVPAPASGEPPTPTGSVALTLSDGRALTLAQTLSADGTRYANSDESFIFWNKGNSALVLENNQEKSYIGCIAAAPESSEMVLPQVYANSAIGFSLRLPSLAGSISKNHLGGYIADEKYRYQGLGPGKDIAGVKFTIPASVSDGTNLASDTYLSVEEIPQTPLCTAALFLEKGVTAYMVPDRDAMYSVASTTGAGAGNRYEETVYAIPDTNPCIAVRYFIHYGAIQNYPEGAVREFDQAALLSTFDAIRHTLIIAP